MNKSVPLIQLAKFGLCLITSAGKTYTVEQRLNNKLSLIDSDGSLAECLPLDTTLDLHLEAKYTSGPVFKCKHPLFADLYLRISKILDAGEYLLTGTYPKVPADKVQRRIDRINVQCVANDIPKAGVHAYAMQGDYLLATEHASPIFVENNNPIIGQNIAYSQVRAKAEEVIWQQEGFLMASVLGLIKS